MRSAKAMLLIGGLMTPAVLIAQNPPPGPPTGAPQRMRMMDGGPGRMGMGPEHMMFAPQMLLNRRARLELTDDQVKQLESLSSDVQKANDKAREDAKPHEDKLRELWAVDQPNAKAIQTEMQAVMAAHQAAGLVTTGAVATAKGLLTPEQRGRVEGWADGRRMGMRRQFDGGPGWGGGQRAYRAHPYMRRF